MIRSHLTARAALALGTVLTLAAAAPVGKPQLGTYGFDTAGMDRAVKPGDSWYYFANGQWEAKTVIPGDKPAYGSFFSLQELSETRTRGILENEAAAQAPGTSGRKAADYYRAFMDEGRIEALGTAPLRAEIDRLTGFNDLRSLAVTFGKAERAGIGTPFGFQFSIDEKDPDAYLAMLGQSGLGLPDRDFYLTPQYEKLRPLYVAHVARVLALAGYADPQGNAQKIFDLETAIAKVHWTRIERRQAEKTYNKFAFADLPAKAPGFDWAAFEEGLGVSSLANLNVAEPTAIASEAALIKSVPLDTWRAYLAFHTASARSSVLPKAFVDEQFALTKVLSGQTDIEERYKRGVAATEGALGEAIGQIYVTKYFPPATKAKADELVHNLLGAFHARLETVAWMAPETRAVALKKLESFRPKIGYPDKFRDYSRLEVRGNDAYGNALRSIEFEFDRDLRRINQPTDRGEWGMTPMTINAYANPVWNEVVFPAAILQPPFFDPNADDAVNYGGIGAVIGHEISHHFDDQGRKYDARGRLASWWTPGDVERFTKLTDRLVKQYDVYEPIPGQHLKGEQVLGENIADVVGITVAHDAYIRSLHGKPAPVIGGLTGDQRFYLGWAQVWREKYRDQYKQLLVTVDVHSLNPYRAATVRNVDAWYAAWGAKPGDKLYLAPADRVKIW